MPRSMAACNLEADYSNLIGYSCLNQVDVVQLIEPDVPQQIFGILRAGFKRPYLAFHAHKSRKSQCIETGIGAYVKDRHVRFDELLQGGLLFRLIRSQPAAMRA